MADGDAGRPASGAGRSEDPLSADRRTMAIAAIAMVALIAIGAVSAAMFTQSACGLAEPDRVAAGAADTDVAAVLEGAFDGLDADGAQQVLEPLAEGLGTPAAAAEVGPAQALTTVEGSLVAAGQRVSVLPGPDALVGPDDVAAAEVDDDTVVVGDGEVLYSLVEVNESTGQVSALVPVGPDLEPGDCYDTAQVGTQLAFHLDGDDGEVLLLRSDDDGELPELELRGPHGAVWSQRIEVGQGPPGALAARLTGLLTEDLVVTARRAQANEDEPAVQVRARDDGRVRWSVDPAEIAERMPPGDDAVVSRVMGATDELVLLAAGREEQQPVLLIALDRDDGSWRWISDVDARAMPRWVGEFGGQPVVLVPQRSVGEEEVTGYELVALDAEGGNETRLYGLDGGQGRAAIRDSDMVLAVGGSVAVVGPDEQVGAVEVGLTVADVAHVGQTTAVLLRDGDEGVVIWLTP